MALLSGFWSSQSTTSFEAPPISPRSFGIDARLGPCSNHICRKDGKRGGVFAARGNFSNFQPPHYQYLMIKLLHVTTTLSSVIVFGQDGSRRGTGWTGYNRSPPFHFPHDALREGLAQNITSKPTMAMYR